MHICFFSDKAISNLGVRKWLKNLCIFSRLKSHDLVGHLFYILFFHSHFWWLVSVHYFIFRACFTRTYNWWTKNHYLCQIRWKKQARQEILRSSVRVVKTEVSMVKRIRVTLGSTGTTIWIFRNLAMALSKFFTSMISIFLNNSSFT